MTLFLALSVLGTIGAVGFGLAAYLTDRNATPSDTWSAATRSNAMNQAERMRAGAERDRQRREGRTWTYMAAACWLWVTAYGAAAATTGADCVWGPSTKVSLCMGRSHTCLHYDCVLFLGSNISNQAVQKSSYSGSQHGANPETLVAADPQSLDR